jgi:hypothetical protein
MKPPYSSAITNDATLNLYRLRIKNLYDLLINNPVDTLSNAAGTHPPIPTTAITDITANTLVGMNKKLRAEALELITKLSNLIEEAIDANQS